MENKELKLSTPAKVQKQTFSSKFREAFTGTDGQKIGDYILFDVLVPAVKKTIEEIVTNGIGMLLYGETRGRSSNLPASRVSYRSYYDSQQRNNNRTSYQSSRVQSNYDNIVLGSRGDAELVLNQMDDVIKNYGFVKVADLYDFVGLSGSYTDNNYGWTDLRNADIVRQVDGYLLRLPRPMPID